MFQAFAFEMEIPLTEMGMTLGELGLFCKGERWVSGRSSSRCF